MPDEPLAAPIRFTKIIDRRLIFDDWSEVDLPPWAVISGLPGGLAMTAGGRTVELNYGIAKVLVLRVMEMMAAWHKRG